MANLMQVMAPIFGDLEEDDDPTLDEDNDLEDQHQLSPRENDDYDTPRLEDRHQRTGYPDTDTPHGHAPEERPSRRPQEKEG